MSTQETLTPENVILKDEKIGSYISEKLSNYLKKYTTKNDRETVAENTSVGVYTIRNVANRSNTLSEENSKAIAELIRIAISKCENAIDDAGDALEELRAILKEK
ncbi:hypothetical protein [Xanthomarina gelatinilytica]|uniref:hypothetical protein n=1 Tax=Xanthomarina gelatinilytica TaxID=1137281 RepID=UPI003AA8DA4C